MLNDLVKSFIKRRVILPVIQGFALNKSKRFAGYLSNLLAILPFSDVTRTRLRTEFLGNACLPSSTNDPEEKNKRLFPLRIAGDPVSYPPVRLITFYLPQFHAISENNEWWGEGFTEWTNVTAAKPQFAGHYQPLQPGELGYYNLDDVDVMRRQALLAEQYGIEGFCFYFYWFGGKRLLEKPILQYLENKDIAQSFCLCWANENWSRRWDGLHNEILIAQNHSPEDDHDFINYVAKYFNDPRYIRIADKPLLLVYRPSLLPDPLATANRWRKWCRENGVGEIYLAYTQSFDTVDPKTYGFDAAVEFPPNNSSPPLITEKVPERNSNFTGRIYDWTVFPERAESYNQPDYTIFRGVCPSWDNTARLKERGTVFLNNSPKGYQAWLGNAIFDTVVRITRKDERFVFVNAWNEWAEGAYLEPDQKFGRAYLEATRKALVDSTKKITGRRVVLVSHDAHPHGAQFLVLNMAKMLHCDFGFTVDLIVLGEGVLMEEYKKYATVHELAECTPESDMITVLVNKLFAQGAKSAIANTTVSGLIVPVLKRCGFHVVSLVHELPQIISDYGLQRHTEAISKMADKVVFAASAVRKGFESFAPLDDAKVVVRPQGLYKRNRFQSANDIHEAKVQLHKRYRLPINAKIVLGVGFADYRKGIDLFVASGIELRRKGYEVYFFWVGQIDQQLESNIMQDVADSGYSEFFIFPGLDYDTDAYYAAADIFALTSREDPFPSVVLEALDAKTPVIAFADSGGAPELLNKGGGILVHEMDSHAFSTALMGLLDNPDSLAQIGREGKKIIGEEFSFRHYLFDLLDFAQVGLRRVSAVVPNFNYERYLPERLESIIGQEYPIYEIVVLDDASTDNSLEIIRQALENCQIDFTIVANKENSGSVFRQWQRGVELAQGTHVWIAEADDSCLATFLDEVIQGFDAPSVVLSYCESKQVDATGTILAENYLDYVSDIGPHRWLGTFVRDGQEEIINALSVKNTIPNVSAVVFEKSALSAVLAEHIARIQSYRIAGDWLTYVLLLQHGRIAFSPFSYNLHRRHQQGVTIGSFNQQHLDEIQRMQNFVAERFDLPEELTGIAGRYIETLRKQFAVGN